MTTSEMFSSFISNLSVKNNEDISRRYGEITRALNMKYRGTESREANTLQVGSYGRYTAINGISDLDMLYKMPSSQWDRFKDGGQSRLLQEVKTAILNRYPNTDVRIGGVVVIVNYSNFMIEVQPAFEQSDGSFKFPNTNNGGSWQITKPKEEIEEVKSFNNKKNRNYRRLCKMIRSWKNKHGVVMGGLLIDTLAYKFLDSTSEYDNKSYTYYDWIVRDFFNFLANEPNKSYYLAPGSNQQVNVKKKFQSKAKKAYKLCLEAIEAGEKTNANTKWKKVFGKAFPASTTVSESAKTWDNTEEFIEDLYPIDIEYSLKIDCEVSQQGFRTYLLREMLQRLIPLIANKKLIFSVVKNDVPPPYTIKWKVLNRGTIAEERNMIRGQILDDEGHESKKENTNFIGEHIVECYVIKDGKVVARDEIDVPIKVGG
jgi:hypothetical protein